MRYYCITTIHITLLSPKLLSCFFPLLFLSCSTLLKYTESESRCSLFLLQGIFSTQGSNPGTKGLPHCRQILYQLSHKESIQDGSNFHTVPRQLRKKMLYQKQKVTHPATSHLWRDRERQLGIPFCRPHSSSPTSSFSTPDPKAWEKRSSLSRQLAVIAPCKCHYLGLGGLWFLAGGWGSLLFPGQFRPQLSYLLGGVANRKKA